MIRDDDDQKSCQTDSSHQELKREKTRRQSSGSVFEHIAAPGLWEPGGQWRFEAGSSRLAGGGCHTKCANGASWNEQMARV
jgi:hypothetical protein